MNFGEPEVAPGIVIGQFLAIEAEQVQEGRVQVVDVNLLLDHPEAGLG